MRASLKRLVPFVAVFVLGCAVGWVAKGAGERRGAGKPSGPPAPSVEVIHVNRPDPAAPLGRDTRTLRVLHVQREGAPVEVPPTDGGRTWVVTLGRFCEPDFASYLAVEP